MELLDGLILGDAAVSANIVSPILVVVVALTGLTAFAIPDYSFGFHIRIARFIYVFAGYFIHLPTSLTHLYLDLPFLAGNVIASSSISPLFLPEGSKSISERLSA